MSDPNGKCRRAAAVLATFIFAMFIAVAIAGCNRNSAEKALESQMHRPPAPVQTVDAIAKDVPSYIDEIGRAVATEVVTVRPQISGKITEIHFVDGADLKKGDLLITIDPRPFQAALDQANAAVAQGQANLKLSQSDLKRMQSLSNTGAVSAQDIETKQNAVAVAEAQIKASEAAAETAKLNLEYCTIESPIDGRAGSRLVDIGNVVATGGADGGTGLLSIQRVVPIYIDFTTAEQNLPEVRDEMARGTLKVEARLSDDDPPRAGKLTFLDNTVQPGAGTIRLRATLENKDRHFWPGEFVKVRLVLATLKDAVLVPAVAEQIGQQGPYVYVVTPKKTAELRLITPGQRQGDLLVVSKGLSVGEAVVVEGQMMVAPGGAVQVMPPPPAGGMPNPLGAGTSGATQPATLPATQEAKSS